MRIPYISVLAAGALALGGCADYYGLGYGGGYSGGYGYGGGPYVGLGYSSGYYSPYYGGYGYGYGSPYGLGGGYFYSGAGTYRFKTYPPPHVMTTTQHSYWSARSPALRSRNTTRAHENWSGFDRRTSTTRRYHRGQTG